MTEEICQTRTETYLGIDLGGTGIKGGLVSRTGELLLEGSVRTPVERGRDGILQSLTSLIADLLQRTEAQPAAIGIGSAGRIDHRSGKVIYATDNLPGWTGTNLADIVSSRFGLPVVADNDVNAAAVGEAWVGAVPGVRSFAFVALGTGVGGALVEEGRLLHGARGGAGEVGHFILHPGGFACNCRQFGCLEQYCSGTALTRAAKRIDSSWSSRTLMEQCNLGDARAEQVIDGFVADLAAGLISIRNMFDPAVIVIGGGLIESRAVWWNRLRSAIAAATPKELPLVPASLGNRAGIVGAAKLAMDRAGGKS